MVKPWSPIPRACPISGCCTPISPQAARTRLLYYGFDLFYLDRSICARIAPCRAQVRARGAVTIASNVLTILGWESEVYDTEGFANVGPSRARSAGNPRRGWL